MKELLGEDLFDQIKIADAICITTNCSVLEDGSNPMGGGCAGAAARLWSEVPNIYGQCLMMMPNVPVILGHIEKANKENFVSVMANMPGITSRTHTALVAYPTMVEIGDMADLSLVERSAHLLVEMASLFFWKHVVIPRPGSGIGGLSWKDEVKPLLESILDNRFVLIHKDFSVNSTVIDSTALDITKLFSVID